MSQKARKQKRETRGNLLTSLAFSRAILRCSEGMVERPVRACGRRYDGIFGLGALLAIWRRGRVRIRGIGVYRDWSLR